MAQALGVVAEILTDGRLDALTVDWGAVRYQHTTAVRTALAERYAPAMANKVLAALRGVLQEAWRLGLMSAEDFHRAADVPSVRGTTLPRGRALKAGEMLDGEGGYTVWGKQLPVARAQEIGGLPLGLAANVCLKRDIEEGASIGWDDVDYDADDEAVRLRREMEAAFGRQNKDAAA